MGLHRSQGWGLCGVSPMQLAVKLPCCLRCLGLCLPAPAQMPLALNMHHANGLLHCSSLMVSQMATDNSVLLFAKCLPWSHLDFETDCPNAPPAFTPIAMALSRLPFGGAGQAWMEGIAAFECLGHLVSIRSKLGRCRALPLVLWRLTAGNDGLIPIASEAHSAAGSHH